MPAYEAIASTTLTGTSSSVTFSSIPSTYEHLQLRVFSRVSGAVTARYIRLQINNDTATNYIQHFLYGNGTSALSNASTGLSFIEIGFSPGASATAGIYGLSITDIVDYASTNKNKTVRGLFGHDRNGAGVVFLGSGLWTSTAAINRLDVFPDASDTFAAGSVFALYGLRSS